LGLAFAEGMQLPAHLAASGKAMLAWKPEADVRGLYRNDPLPKMTHAGPEDVDQLLADLRIVRESGYSVDDECVREGVVSFAAPVFDRTGAAVAGIGLCVHKTTASDFSPEGYPRRVVDLARQLTRRIGGTPPQPLAA
jgi:IclR family transcriptional regulator, blcABC operon repressor